MLTLAYVKIANHDVNYYVTYWQAICYKIIEQFHTFICGMTA